MPAILPVLATAALIAWAASLAVLALILLASRAGGDTARRAATEADLIARRVLRSLAPAALLAALPAVLTGSAGTPAWAAAALLASAGLAMPRRKAALRGASRAAACHAGALAVLTLSPGPQEVLILAGLGTCLGLAASLAAPPHPRPRAGMC
jgi:hypothetical protein